MQIFSVFSGFKIFLHFYLPERMRSFRIKITDRFQLPGIGIVPFIFPMLLFIPGCNVTENDTMDGVSDERSLHIAGTSSQSFYIEGIRDLRKGDILVKPNTNFLPGSSVIPDGHSFGHAVMVTSGYEHNNIDSLLTGIKVIESTSLNVPPEFQIREIEGYAENNSLIKNNTSFGSAFKGRRYRLRYEFTESQIDSMIEFMRNQKGDYSTWGAMKKFNIKPGPHVIYSDSISQNWADNTHWYCSLLIWQAVLYVTGIDLDPNGGYYIYPNDLIKSPYFDNDDHHMRRVKF